VHTSGVAVVIIVAVTHEAREAVTMVALTFEVCEAVECLEGIHKSQTNTIKFSQICIFTPVAVAGLQCKM